MFSPTVPTVRRLVINRMFNSTPPLDPTEPDPVELETLSKSDQDVLYDLYDLEEQFQLYTSPRFNFTQIQFIPRTGVVGDPLDSTAMIKLLAPTASSTKQFLYRLHGFQNLLPDLQSLRPTHPSLATQRDELIAATNTEIELLLAGVERERLAQQARTVTVDNIRRVDPGASRSLFPKIPYLNQSNSRVKLEPIHFAVEHCHHCSHCYNPHIHGCRSRSLQRCP